MIVDRNHQPKPLQVFLPLIMEVRIYPDEELRKQVFRTPATWQEDTPPGSAETSRPTTATTPTTPQKPAPSLSVGTKQTPLKPMPPTAAEGMLVDEESGKGGASRGTPYTTQSNRSSFNIPRDKQPDHHFYIAIQKEDFFQMNAPELMEKACAFRHVRDPLMPGTTLLLLDEQSPGQESIKGFLGERGNMEDNGDSPAEGRSGPTPANEEDCHVATTSEAVDKSSHPVAEGQMAERPHEDTKKESKAKKQKKKPSELPDGEIVTWLDKTADYVLFVASSHQEQAIEKQLMYR